MSKISYDTKYGNTIANKLSYPEAVNEQVYNSVNAGKFEGFLPLRTHKKKNDVTVECTVQGLVPVSYYFYEEVTEKMFLGFVSEVIRRLRVCESNMIDPNNLVLDLDMMYVDPVQRKYKFIYWPIVNNKISIPASVFFRELPSRLRFSHYEDHTFLTVYMQFFNTTAPFSLRDFDKMISGLRPAKIPTSSADSPSSKKAPEPPAKINIFEKGKASIEYDPFAPADTDDKSKNRITARSPSSDYVFCQECGTKNEINSAYCSLCGKSLHYPKQDAESKKKVSSNKPSVTGNKPIKYARPKCATLIRVKTQEAFYISKPIFKIGSNEVCDVVIKDNTYISRVHASIITKKSHFYLIDRKSTNKTYLNGLVLPCETEIEISSGAKISLADEDFIFRIE